MERLEHMDPQRARMCYGEMHVANRESPIEPKSYDLARMVMNRSVVDPARANPLDRAVLLYGVMDHSGIWRPEEGPFNQTFFNQLGVDVSMWPTNSDGFSHRHPSGTLSWSKAEIVSDIYGIRQEEISYVDANVFERDDVVIGRVQPTSAILPNGLVHHYANINTRGGLTPSSARF